MADCVPESVQGTFHLPSWYKYTGEGHMSIAEKLVVAVL